MFRRCRVFDESRQTPRDLVVQADCTFRIADFDPQFFSRTDQIAANRKQHSEFRGLFGCPGPNYGPRKPLNALPFVSVPFRNRPKVIGEPLFSVRHDLDFHSVDSRSGRLFFRQLSQCHHHFVMRHMVAHGFQADPRFLGVLSQLFFVRQCWIGTRDRSGHVKE